MFSIILKNENFYAIMVSIIIDIVFLLLYIFWGYQKCSKMQYKVYHKLFLRRYNIISEIRRGDFLNSKMFKFYLPPPPPITLSDKIVPPTSNVRYLELILDKLLTWVEHLKQKRLLLNTRRKSLHHFLGKHTNLTLKNKLILWKTFLKPIRSYGVQLWSTTKKSNIYKMQSSQSVSERIITNAPFYISNHTLHTDLNVSTIIEVDTSSYKLFRARLVDHLNPLILALNSKIIISNPPRSLSKNWCRDLAWIIKKK